MPRGRRRNLLPALLSHLFDRIQQRGISVDQLRLLAEWLDAEPEVPPGRCFKKFSGIPVCGEGRLIETLLQPDQAATGEESQTS